MAVAFEFHFTIRRIKARASRRSKKDLDNVLAINCFTGFTYLPEKSEIIEFDKQF